MVILYYKYWDESNTLYYVAQKPCILSLMFTFKSNYKRKKSNDQSLIALGWNKIFFVELNGAIALYNMRSYPTIPPGILGHFWTLVLIRNFFSLENFWKWYFGEKNSFFFVELYKLIPHSGKTLAFYTLSQFQYKNELENSHPGGNNTDAH